MEKKNIRVLLAEDDRNLGNILKDYLIAKGYDVTLCVNGQEAFNAFKKLELDFCIIDIMMPVKDGFTLIKEIRQIDSRIPLLILTAKSLQEDKLKGFELGADDYLTKPFSMDELLMRIQAILRRTEKSRSEAGAENIFNIGKYSFDFNRHLLTIQQKQQKLTSKEAALLRLLCQQQNEVVDRSMALQRIWNDDNYFNARSMDVYIVKLRKYLRDDPDVELMNVHGVGFKLVVNTQS
ncbi:MAG: response regulator transcription factor [Bacteroidetes bacterium]|nr:response regulator transcription factor [Bacteroidota bacterium]